MTRDEIIRLADEAGFVVDEKARQHQPNCIFHTHHMIDEGLTRFAALVAKREREACAKVCEEQMKSYMSKRYTTDPLGGFRERFAAEQCAAAIRARGEQEQSR